MARTKPNTFTKYASFIGQKMTQLGFIGLGHMGMPMALQLSQQFSVIAYDQNPQACTEFRNLGGQDAPSLEAMLENVHVVISMLPNGRILMSVYQEIIGLIPKHALLIDSSTIGPLASLEWHAMAKQHGFRSVDAPVSGGVKAAKEGRLSFMLGGSTENIEAAKTYLQPLGKNFIHTGDAGSGQAAKICNNLVLANTMIAVSEAFALANRLQLNPQKLYEVLKTSSGNSWVIENYLPVPNLLKDVPAENDYQAGFSGTMMLKDLKLANEAAKHLEQNLKLSQSSQDIYQDMIDQNQGDKDFSYIYQLLADN
jgi:3-hydroxyisobutyrate dehydrogenase